MDSSTVRIIGAFLCVLLLSAAGCDRGDPADDRGATEPTEADEHSPESGEWCAGHGLPESHCTKCHPELVDKFKEAGDWCAEHGFPESACPTCNPMEAPGESRAGKSAPIPGVEAGTVIRFKDDDHEAEVGVEVVRVKEASMGVARQAPARIEFNRNAVADVRASVPGIVRKVLVDLGDEVDAGAALFVLESAQVGKLQAEIHAAEQHVETARANLERKEKLVERGLAASKSVEEARRDLEQAQSRLTSLQGAIRMAGASGGASTGRYTLRAPIAGSIVRRPAVVGAFATEEMSLATVADTSTMWAMMDVASRDAATLGPGQPVTLSVEGVDAEFEGELTWISSEVDRRTRTVKARAEIANPDAQLRANQYGRASIGVQAGQRALVVPRDAIQQIEDASVVFVRTERGVYEPRAVKPGRVDADQVQVTGALSPGESVVTTGAFILKTELSRDSIGAGCCEVE